MKYAIFLLGNPGNDYKLTRHNAARILFENDSSIIYTNDNTKNCDEQSIILDIDFVIPDTYMNLSGVFVKNYLKYKSNVTPIIGYDDKDIELGKYKIGVYESSGGHNGVQNIIDQLGNNKFLRLRIGITPKELMPIHGEGVVQGFVMGKFREEEVRMIKGLRDSIVKDLQKYLISNAN